jgi:hypothetical protein
LACAGLPDRRHGGGHGGGGGQSGGHGTKTCIIAPAGTTNCTGVTGANCSDSANLKVSKKYFNVKCDFKIANEVVAWKITFTNLIYF